MKNAAVPEIFDLVFGVDPALDLDFIGLSARTGDHDRYTLARLQFCDTGDGDGFSASETKAGPALSLSLIHI